MMKAIDTYVDQTPLNQLGFRSLFWMTATVLCSAGAIWAFQADNKVSAMMAIVGALLSLLAWLLHFLGGIASLPESEFEQTLTAFGIAYAIVAVALLFPASGLNDALRYKDEGEVLNAVYGFWDKISFWHLTCLAVAIVVSAIVAIAIGYKLGTTFGVSSVGVGLLLSMLMAVAFFLVMLAAAIVVAGALGLIAATSRAVQGK
jgi:hypothetical protein